MADTRVGMDYEGITARQKEAWAAGDFTQIARQNVVMAEALCEATDPRAGDRVLDLACGSGTAALVAARRYCEVTGIDYVPQLIEQARARAAASGLDADFRVADAQDLPFDADSFDSSRNRFLALSSSLLQSAWPGRSSRRIGRRGASPAPPASDSARTSVKRRGRGHPCGASMFRLAGEGLELPTDAGPYLRPIDRL